MEIKEGIIPVRLRVGLKKSDTKKLRRNDLVPAIVYGPKQKNRPVALDVRLAEKLSRKEYENKILTFQSKDTDLNGLKVIKKDSTRHPLRQTPLHLDFLSLDMARPVRVSVEVSFQGKPKGVREEGGVFNAVLRAVEVECLPLDIPSALTVDVTDLSLNENLHVSDLQIPKNIKLITGPERTLCAVAVAKEEEKAEEKTEEDTAKQSADSPSPSPAGKPGENKS